MGSVCHVFVFCFILFLCGCKEKPKPVGEAHVVPDTLSAAPLIRNDRELKEEEENEYLFDTSFPVSINGKSYQLLLKRDEFPSENYPDNPTTTVRVVDEL